MAFIKKLAELVGVFLIQKLWNYIFKPSVQEKIEDRKELIRLYHDEPDRIKRLEILKKLEKENR